MKVAVSALLFALVAQPLGCGDDGVASPAADAQVDVRDTGGPGDADAAPDASEPDASEPDATEEVTDTAGPEVEAPCGAPCGDHAACVDEQCVCDPGALSSGGACVLPVTITGLRIAPQTLHAMSPAEAIFEVREARACQLESPLFMTPRTIDPASLAAGRLAFEVSREEIEAAPTVGGWVEVVLRCEGAGASGDNVAAASIHIRIAAGPGIVITPSATVLPAEGGRIDLCWHGYGAAYCAVFAPEHAQEGLAPSGCLEDLAVSPESVSDFSVVCGDGLGDGVGTMVQETVRVVAGTGIRHFEVSPMVLGQAGTTHVAWEAGGVDACVLSQDGALLGEGASGAIDLHVEAEATIALTCTAGDTTLVESRIVSVGAAILGFAFGARGPDDLWWEALADACTLAVANEAYSVVLEDLPAAGKDASMSLPAPTLSRHDGLEITLTCTRGAYVAKRSLSVAPVPHVTSLTFDPLGLTRPGGQVTACWTSERADSCWLYLQGSGDGVGPFAPDDCEQLDVSDWMYVRLECYGADGAADVAEREVPIGSFGALTADPPTLVSPGRSTLSWQTGGLDACILLQDGALLGEVASTGTREVEVATDSDFVLRCSSGGGIVDHAARISVGAGIDVFDVVAASRGAGVSWATRQVEGCSLRVVEADGRTLTFAGLPPQQAAGVTSGGGVKPPHKGGVPGFVVPHDRSRAATFTLTCTGPGGSFAQSVTVPAAVPVEILSLTVTPAELPAEGAVVDLCVTSVGADMCAFTLISLETGIGQAIAMPVGGNEFSRGNGCISRSGFPDLFIEETSEITVTCAGFESTAEARVIVDAGMAIGRFVAEPVALAQPGAVTLSWASLFASSCTLARDGEVLAEDLTSDGTLVALDATATFTLTCRDDAGHTVERALRVPVGADLTVVAAATAPSQIVVRLASVAIDSCLVVATNGDTTMGTGHDFEREPAPVNGEVYFDWQFEFLGRADIIVTCRDASGTSWERTAFVDPPPAPSITAFEVPTGFAAPGAGDACFASSGAAWCDLWVEGIGGYQYAAGAGCWSDDGRGPLAFAHTTTIGLVCYSALGVSTMRQAIVPVGPSIVTFEVDRTALEAPGDVAVSWSTFGMASCALLAGDGVVSERASGATTLAVDADADLLLSCVDAAGDVHEREVAVRVGPQIEWLLARAWDAATVGVEWRALFVDACAVTIETASGEARGVVADLPAEAGLGFEWSFAADGAAHVELRCGHEGGEELVAVATVVAPTEPVITSFAALPGGLDAPGEIDVCWTTSGAVVGCTVQATGRAPSASSIAFWTTDGNGCASTAAGFEALLALDGTHDVSLTCQGPLGQANAQIAVPVGPDIITLRAAPSWLDAPGRTTLEWDSHAVTDCTLTDDADEVVATGVRGAIDVTVADATAFTLICTTPRGEVRRTLGVGVGPAVFIEAASPADAEVLLVAWRAERSDYCMLTIVGGDEIGETFYLGPVGRERFYYPFAARGDARLEMACEGSQTVAASAEVASPMPRVSTFTVEPGALSGPGLATLCWTTARADSCALDVGGDLTTDLAPDQCLDVEIGLATDVSLTCGSVYGVAAAALTIPVGPTITAFTSSHEQVPLGGYFVTLTWDSVLTDGCTLSAGADPIATGASGAVRYFVAVETPFTLTCVAGPKPLTRSLVVTVTTP